MICNYHFNHKLNLKGTLSVCDCQVVSITKGPWKNKLVCCHRTAYLGDKCCLHPLP